MESATAGPSSRPGFPTQSFGGFSGVLSPGRSHSIFLEDLKPLGGVLDDDASLVEIEEARIAVYSILQREKGEINYLNTLVRSRRHLGTRLIDQLDEKIAESGGTLFSELSGPEDNVGGGGGRSESRAKE
jgi:hypothetical protein